MLGFENAIFFSTEEMFELLGIYEMGNHVWIFYCCLSTMGQWYVRSHPTLPPPSNLRSTWRTALLSVVQWEPPQSRWYQISEEHPEYASVWGQTLQTWQVGLGLVHTFVTVLPSNVQYTLRQTCSKKGADIWVESKKFNVVRKVLCNNYQSGNLIGTYHLEKFNFVHQTDSRQEAHMGWARD